MMKLVMPELVTENCNKFVRRKLLHQSNIQNDALRLSYSCKIRI